jgi:hypothetical protein
VDGNYLSGNTTCMACDSACVTCSGGTNRDCLTCETGKNLQDGACITTDPSFYEWLNRLDGELSFDQFLNATFNLSNPDINM